MRVGKSVPRKRKPWGGKRDGAGRPSTPDPTSPIRVPGTLAPWIKDNLDKIRELKEKEEK
jgi:hypothetical protein